MIERMWGMNEIKSSSKCKHRLGGIASLDSTLNERWQKRRSTRIRPTAAVVERGGEESET